MTKRDRLLAWAIVASHFGPPFMFSGVAVALPAMGADLGAGATSLGLVETLFLAGGLAFLLPVGRLADATDKRTLYKLGLLGFALTSILIGVLSWMPAILGVRFLQGAASAVFSATGPAILADIVPPEKRGRIYGSSIGVIYAGLTLGPIVAGYLIDVWGWRAVFLAGAAALLAAWLLVRSVMPSTWRKPTATAHAPSTVLVFVAVLCLVAGSATLRNGLAGYAFLAGGLVLATVFVRLQRHLANPLVDVGALMTNRILRGALLVQLLLYMSAFSSIFMLSIYMQVTLGHPAKTAGQVIAIGTVLMAVVAPVAGGLADRYPPRVVASCGVACLVVSSLLAVTLHATSGLWSVALVLAVQGLGFGLFSSPNMTQIMNSVSENARGMASALGAKARSLGMLTGMIVTAVLISLRIGDDPVDGHPGMFLGTMTTVFSILAAVSGLALAVCWATRTRAVNA